MSTMADLRKTVSFLAREDRAATRGGQWDAAPRATVASAPWAFSRVAHRMLDCDRSPAYLGDGLLTDHEYATKRDEAREQL